MSEVINAIRKAKAEMDNHIPNKPFEHGYLPLAIQCADENERLRTQLAEVTAERDRLKEDQERMIESIRLAEWMGVNARTVIRRQRDTRAKCDITKPLRLLGEFTDRFFESLQESAPDE